MQVLRRHDPAAAAYDDDQWSLLRAHQLDRTPEYIPVAGPLVLLRPAAADLDLQPFEPSVALSAATLQAVTAARCTARAVVTIENATSFTEFLRVRPADVLAVYIGGFASPSVLRLLGLIRAQALQARLCHWGDLDAGGLRILAQLRGALGSVAPLGMSAAHLAESQGETQPLTAGDQAALARLRADPRLADCEPLIAAMLAAGRKLEQEALAVELIANELASGE